jgi:cell division protein FtsN
MDPKSSESGADLVLDNRKLIIAFLLLVVVCGAFFIIGFMEGKRQAVQAREERTQAAPATPDAASAAGAKQPAARPETTPVEDRSVRSQLDWYKNVQGADKGAAQKTVDAAKPESSTTRPDVKKAAASRPQAAVSMIPAADITYTVQVGAFRQRREAEVKQEALKAKGYSCVVEAPQPANQLYLVKVGKFNTRADAKAMQLRLQKDGFSSFIKVN